jgi:hypothetical protein
MNVCCTVTSDKVQSGIARLGNEVKDGPWHQRTRAQYEPLKESTAMQLNGQNESYALLPIYAAPPPVPAFAGLGSHALTFAGEVDLASLQDAIKQLKENLDDADDVLTWDLDITVGPDWREVRTAAPLVVVTDVFSTSTDSDDRFESGVVFRSPKWTVEGVSGHEKIVLHVSVLQAGEDLMMLRLGYSVTATGYLRNPAALVP